MDYNNKTIKFNFYSERSFEILECIWWLLRDFKQDYGLGIPIKCNDNQIALYFKYEEGSSNSVAEIIDFVSKNLSKYLDKKSGQYVFKSESWCWENVDHKIDVMEMNCFIDIAKSKTDTEILELVKKYGKDMVDNLIGCRANPIEFEKNKIEDELALEMKTRKEKEQNTIVHKFKSQLTKEKIKNLAEEMTVDEIVEYFVDLQNKLVKDYLKLEDSFKEALYNTGKRYIE